MFVTTRWNFTLATTFRKKGVADVLEVRVESEDGTAAEQG